MPARLFISIFLYFVCSVMAVAAAPHPSLQDEGAMSPLYTSSSAALLTSPFANTPSGGSSPSLADENRYTFEFIDVALDRALYVVSESAGADIIYESDLTTGKTVTAAYKEMTLRMLLDDMLEPHGLEAQRIRTGVYVIRPSLRRALDPAIRLVSVQGGVRPEREELMAQLRITDALTGMDLQDGVRLVVAGAVSGQPTGPGQDAPEARLWLVAVNRKGYLPGQVLVYAYRQGEGIAPDGRVVLVVHTTTAPRNPGSESHPAEIKLQPFITSP